MTMKTSKLSFGYSYGKMKDFDQIPEGALKQRKNRMSSAFKRFVGRISKDKKKTKEIVDFNSFQEVQSEQINDSAEELGLVMSDLGLVMSELVPEILRVSPMHKSCEVTLISSSFDESVCEKEEPQTQHIITVKQGDKDEFDESYHVVLNPYRRSRTNYSFYDEEKHHQAETGSNDITQDTSDESCSLDSDRDDDDCNIYGVTEFDTEKHLDIDGYLEHNGDYEFGRARRDFFVNRSLFNASESDDEDDESFTNFLEELDQSSIPVQEYKDHEVSKPEGLYPTGEILSITVDKSVEGDLQRLLSTDDEHSIQFIVENVSF